MGWGAGFVDTVRSKGAGVAKAIDRTGNPAGLGEGNLLAARHGRNEALACDGRRNLPDPGFIPSGCPPRRDPVVHGFLHYCLTSYPPFRSARLYVRGLEPARPAFRPEEDALPGSQVAYAGAGQDAGMREHLPVAAVRHDEPEGRRLAGGVLRLSARILQALARSRDVRGGARASSAGTSGRFSTSTACPGSWSWCIWCWHCPTFRGRCVEPSRGAPPSPVQLCPSRLRGIFRNFPIILRAA